MGDGSIQGASARGTIVGHRRQLQPFFPWNVSFVPLVSRFVTSHPFRFDGFLTYRRVSTHSTSSFPSFAIVEAIFRHVPETWTVRGTTLVSLGYLPLRLATCRTLRRTILLAILPILSCHLQVRLLSQLPRFCRLPTPCSVVSETSRNTNGALGALSDPPIPRERKVETTRPNTKMEGSPARPKQNQCGTNHEHVGQGGPRKRDCAGA